MNSNHVGRSASNIDNDQAVQLESPPPIVMTREP